MPFDPIKLSSGYLMPGITFGTGSEWRANPRETDPETGVASEVCQAMIAAVKAGFRSFDTAENYRNERSLGVALKSSDLPRDALFVTSKVHFSMADPRAAIRRQLDLLELEQLDLYLIHTPLAVPEGSTLLDSWRAMEALVDEGLTKSIGVSNFEPKHFEAFYDAARIKPAVNQIALYPYTLHKVQPNLDYCKAHNIQVTTYEVSTSLLRAGEKGGPLDAVLESIAAEIGAEVTPGQILLSWSSAKGCIPVTTSRKASRMKEYIEAGDFRLSEAQVAAIDSAGVEGAKLGFGKFSSWS